MIDYSCAESTWLLHYIFSCFFFLFFFERYNNNTIRGPCRVSVYTIRLTRAYIDAAAAGQGSLLYSIIIYITKELGCCCAWMADGCTSAGDNGLSASDVSLGLYICVCVCSSYYYIGLPPPSVLLLHLHQIMSLLLQSLCCIYYIDLSHLFSFFLGLLLNCYIAAQNPANWWWELNTTSTIIL